MRENAKYEHCKYEVLISTSNYERFFHPTLNMIKIFSNMEKIIQRKKTPKIIKKHGKYALNLNTKTL